MKESLEQSRKLGANIRRILDSLDPAEDRELEKSGAQKREIELSQEAPENSFVEELEDSVGETKDTSGNRTEREEPEQKAELHEETKAKEEEPKEEPAKPDKRKRKKKQQHFPSYQSNKDGIFED